MDPAVTVDADRVPTPVHANRIVFQALKQDWTGKKVRPYKVYIAAQSPPANHAGLAPGKGESENYDNLLKLGIESGEGLFEFVTRKVQGEARKLISADSPATDPAVPGSVLNDLMERLVQQPDGVPLIIGGRYRVIELGVEDQSHDHLCCCLRVEDTTIDADEHGARPVIEIPLTQAGLRFRQRVLRAPEILRAKEILDLHVALRPRANVCEPNILSHAGVGRNATLIVYDAMSTLIREGAIDDLTTLDRNLYDLIHAGRAQRGPRFIQSEEQLSELRLVLVDELRAHKKAEALEVLRRNLLQRAADTGGDNNQTVHFFGILDALCDIDTFARFSPDQLINAFDALKTFPHAVILNKPTDAVAQPAAVKAAIGGAQMQPSPNSALGRFLEDQHLSVIDTKSDFWSGLLQAIVQQAMGEPNDVNHSTGVVEVLRVIMEAKFFETEPEAGEAAMPNRTENETTVGENAAAWALETINGLFGCDLDLHLLNIGHATETDGSTTEFPVLTHLAGHGTEPIITRLQ